MTAGLGKPLALQTNVTSVMFVIVSKVVPIGTVTGLVDGQVLFVVEVSMTGSSGSKYKNCLKVKLKRSVYVVA